ncbi:MAG: acyl-CoA synthetase [Rhodospirillales bacterium]
MRKAMWILLCLVALLVISLPTVLLLLFGMLPTIVAWVIDRSQQKYATFCVCGMNFSGVFPFLSDVWFKDHSTDAAVRILTNVFDLTVIYGAAAFGWMMFIAVPPVITQFISAMLQKRVATLREQQQKIIEEWGEGVSMLVAAQQQPVQQVRPQKGRARR